MTMTLISRTVILDKTALVSYHNNIGGKRVNIVKVVETGLFKCEYNYRQFDADGGGINLRSIDLTEAQALEMIADMYNEAGSFDVIDRTETTVVG